MFGHRARANLSCVKFDHVANDGCADLTGVAGFAMRAIDGDDRLRQVART